MPVKLPPPPPNGQTILRQNKFGASGRRLATMSSAPGPVRVTQPHRVYAVDRDALLRNELLEVAKPVAWRYLLVDEDTALSAAELIEREDGSLTFAEANSGPFVHATAEVLAAAERLDDVQRDDFELRLLRVPSVCLVALWLRGSATDLLLPLAPAPDGLDAGRAYQPSEILAIVKPQAEARAAFEARKDAESQ